ncbi:MAG TPA: hypothetical protein VMT66_01785 [Steroidobacteraceae bacterium]|nr:hypothetical protein [Steroidobacteraceae bacterium]
MRVAVSCAMAVLVVGVSSAVGIPSLAGLPSLAGVAGVGSFTRAARCAAPTDHETVRPKPSSFAPHPGAQNRVYGAPIQPRILKSRPKKKDPELRSAALPES